MTLTHFADLTAAISFGQVHGFTFTSEQDPTGEAHALHFGAALMGLQQAINEGRYRVVFEEEEEPADLSWDDTGETRAHLESGHYVNMFVRLEQRDPDRETWIGVDAVGGCIGTRADVARLGQCYAADWFAAWSAPGQEDNDDCDYLTGIPGQPFAGASVQTVPELWSYALAGGECTGDTAK